MEQSLGLVEVRGLSGAIAAADVMVKAANVTLVELESARGSGMMTVKVSGDVGAVRAAVEAGSAAAIACGAFISADVIARPIASTETMFLDSSRRRERPMFYNSQMLPAAVADSPASSPQPEEPHSDPTAREAAAETVSDAVAAADLKTAEATEPEKPETKGSSASPQDTKAVSATPVKRTRKSKTTAKRRKTSKKTQDE
ncbi:BMC domain-containing protein [Megasphaera paucivorans]|uniref:BMC domain-containing protein n=1 Tax=Megasphaera paucivorans TaxID=349095 RepID=A0A1G9SJG7_9FIRM|nr:BMC domain-containing protein [Megasphaera paucivorans]SDM35447.1 BMC domain-containing protein [Megasphaera paucivorans]